MYGNGVLMNGIVIIKMLLQVAAFGATTAVGSQVVGCGDLEVVHRCGAVLGSPILMLAVLRVASAIIGALTTATILVFVLSAMAG